MNMDSKYISRNQFAFNNQNKLETTIYPQKKMQPQRNNLIPES